MKNRSRQTFQAMSTLYQIVYHADRKNSPSRCEHKWPGTGRYGRNLFSGFEISLLFTDFRFGSVFCSYCPEEKMGITISFP